MHIETYRYRNGDWDGSFDLTSDGPNTLLLAFGDSTQLDDAEVIAELAAAFPTSVLMGCSTAGEILDARVEDNSLTVAVVRFERSRLKYATAPLKEIDGSRRAGESLAEQLSDDHLQAAFVLSNGLDVNGSELVRGLNSGLDPAVLVTGGLAGDGPRFRRTWVIVDGQPRTGYSAAVGFYGEHLRVGHGCQGGWEIFGPDRRVTRSAGNVLYELDGRPALQLYKDYLGELSAGLPGSALRFPLALKETVDDDRQLVRTVLSVSEADQSMTFAGDIPQGWMAQLMRSSVDQLIEGAAQAARASGTGADSPVPGLAIAVSCVGRRMVLREAVDEEVEATLEYLPAGTRQIGFYSYGELSPYASGACDLHNQTMTLTTLQEV